VIPYYADLTQHQRCGARGTLKTFLTGRVVINARLVAQIRTFEAHPYHGRYNRRRRRARTSGLPSRCRSV